MVPLLVYFIQAGSVDGVLSYRNNFTFTRILQGNMLGEVDIILHKEKRKYCFMTKKGAELLTLSKREFKKLILVDFRDIGKQILTQAEKKMKLLRTDYKKALIHARKSKEKSEFNNEFPVEEKEKNEKNEKVKIFIKGGGFLMVMLSISCLQIKENFKGKT